MRFLRNEDVKQRKLDFILLTSFNGVVGADAHIGPIGGFFIRADVGIGPYEWLIYLQKPPARLIPYRRFAYPFSGL